MNSILESSLRPELDALLLSGSTVYDLEKWCKERGLLVSASTIKRYAEAHLPDWSGSKVKNQPVVTEAKPPKSYKVELSNTEIKTQFNQIIIDNFNESMVNLSTLVNLKIGEYCRGESPIPKDDVALLEKFIGMFNSITAKHNKDRAGNNIFDIDTALSQAEKKTDDDDVETLESILASMRKNDEEVEELNYE